MNDTQSTAFKAAFSGEFADFQVRQTFTRGHNLHVIALHKTAWYEFIIKPTGSMTKRSISKRQAYGWRELK